MSASGYDNLIFSTFNALDTNHSEWRVSDWPVFLFAVGGWSTICVVLVSC